MVIRLIEAGTVSALRSQTIYHGLAYARTDATPDTVVLATPGEPYVCIGFHQDVEREVDLEFCRRRGLPVLRRETGGGAVYLDRDQLFVQWVMGPASLPARIEERFALFARPLVATYRELGMPARFRPVNDVHVDGRKIAGTGAGRIGDAEVLIGNFIFDFDTHTMARVLAAPSPGFRDQVDRSLRAYMTSMQRELGSVPDRREVAALYRRKCAEALGQELRPGELTAEESAAIAAVDRRFRSTSFLRRPGGLRRPGVKIHEDVRVVESVHRTDGGVIRVTARLHGDRIEDVTLVGVPRTGLAGLEAALRGVELSPEPVARTVRACGLDADAWVPAILDLQPAGGREP